MQDLFVASGQAHGAGSLQVAHHDQRCGVRDVVAHLARSHYADLIILDGGLLHIALLHAHIAVHVQMCAAGTRCASLRQAFWEGKKCMHKLQTVQMAELPPTIRLSSLLGT